MTSPFPKSSSLPGEGHIVVRLLPNNVSALESITYQYPLKLISPASTTEQGSVLVFLLSYGGGLVGGDKINLSIDVQPRAKLSIVTQGHTKIFRSATPDIVTRQNLNVEIKDGAALCLLPDPVQPFESSIYEQIQIFKLTTGGSLCLLDWVTKGALHGVKTGVLADGSGAMRFGLPRMPRLLKIGFYSETQSYSRGQIGLPDPLASRVDVRTCYHRDFNSPRPYDQSYWRILSGRVRCITAHRCARFP